jgi:hypothetical protein
VVAVVAVVTMLVALLHCIEPISKIRNKYSQKRNCVDTSPNFHIHVSVSNLYIPTTDLPILGNMWSDPGNI